MSIKVNGINLSGKRGTVKRSVETVIIDKNGIVGDAHAGHWHRQISLLSQESIDQFSQKMNREIKSGEFAENIILEGLDFSQIAVLDRLKINTVLVEVTQIGKKCHGNNCSIFKEVGDCIMPKEGIFTRVIKGGKIEKEDHVKYIPYTFKIKIITVSDRASRSEYKDLSGPEIKNQLDEFFKTKRWNPEYTQKIIPDDAGLLKKELIYATKNKTDIIITTGGTGIGPRDITPDIVTEYCDKLIPGIMDHIRIKYGSKIPNALISRSVAGVANQTLIYTIPGSVKAVKEYMQEILLTVEHLILMLHGMGH
jgi:molybdenum cofactor synthesis domain-containing protein